MSLFGRHFQPRLYDFGRIWFVLFRRKMSDDDRDADIDIESDVGITCGVIDGIFTFITKISGSLHVQFPHTTSNSVSKLSPLWRCE